MKTKLTGTFLGIPYDFRAPTWSVIKERAWNPKDKRIFTPHILGWGYSVNLYQIFKKLGLIKK